MLECKDCPYFYKDIKEKKKRCHCPYGCYKRG